MSDPLTTAYISQADYLVHAWLDATSALDQAQQRLSESAEQLVDLLGDRGYHELTDTPGVGVKIVPPSVRFKPALAKAKLTEAQLRAISLPTPSAAQARAVLPPELYRQLTAPDERPSVRVL